MSQTTILNFFTSNSTPKKSGAPHLDTQKWKVGDIVWAQLDGYPYWPGIINYENLTNKYFKLTHDHLYYVQFVENPISYAWISEKFIKNFDDSFTKELVRLALIKDDNLASCVKIAEKMYTMQPKQRLDYNYQKHLRTKCIDENKENINFEKLMVENDFEEEIIINKKSRKLIYSDDEDEPIKDISLNEVKNHNEGSRCLLPTPNKKKKSNNISTNLLNISQNFKYQKLEEDDDIQFSESYLNTTLDVCNLSALMSTPNKEYTNKSQSSFLSEQNEGSFLENLESLGKGDQNKFTHQTLEWLKPGKRKDSEGRVESHPDYDGRTLYVPPTYMSKLTPGLKQWWRCKALRFDCVLFFKVGKFYELYHMDAVLCVELLGLTYMRGGSSGGDLKMAHAGFPEIAYGRYADSLVEKGYRVCRVEQTETVQAMEQRRADMKKDSPSPRNGSTGDKVVSREVCRITSKGTKTYGYLDATNETCGDNRYLMAICEKVMNHMNLSQGWDLNLKPYRYGVCLADTTVGKFMVGEFEDDEQRSNLRTLITHNSPIELLLERNRIGKDTQKILQQGCSSDCVKQFLTPGKEFWEAGATMKYFKEKLQGATRLDSSEVEISMQQDYCQRSKSMDFASLLKTFSHPGDLLSLTPKNEYALAVKALGACVWYLQDCLIDHELTTVQNVSIYTPPALLQQAGNPSSRGEEKGRGPKQSSQQYMILDDVTLTNLEVIKPISNSIATDTAPATLYDRLQPYVSTAMGRRLLKNWLCTPLADIKGINIRLDAVEDLGLNAGAEFVREVTDQAKTVPDLERLLLRVHSLSVNRSPSHPDSRAVMFEESTYSKRKIDDFVSTIKGLLILCEIINKIRASDINFKSGLIRNILNLRTKRSENVWQMIVDFLNDFMHTYNFEKAKKDGIIIPAPGIIPEYDEAMESIKGVEEELTSILLAEQKRLKCTLTYWGTGKNRCQIEVPESHVKRVPDNYEFKSQRKGAKRYRTKEIESLLQDLNQYEYERDQGLSQSMRKIFAKFDEKADLWKVAVNSIATLDVLIAFARYSFFDTCDSMQTARCRPQMTGSNCNVEPPFLEIIQATHPCLTSNTFSGGDFIPNDIYMNCERRRENNTGGSSVNFNGGKGATSLTILTGPNMGGKSTLLRQVGLISILAHVGCYVPAQSCKMSVIDRIFTRLGAHDNIIRGESTFFVELKETATILNHATVNSLVLLDELGRGTATYDGVAIAHSVIRHMTEDVKCRTLFSTHYHSLVDEFSQLNSVTLVHMACMVENDEYFTKEISSKKEITFEGDRDAITFLYKLVPGACPNSYGFHAALLAGMPPAIVAKAFEVAKKFENESRTRATFQNIMKLLKFNEENRELSPNTLIENVKRLMITP